MSQELTTSETQTSIVMPSGPKKEAIVVAMENAGINESYIAENLKDIIDNAITANPRTWDIMVDYATRLQWVKAWHKIASWKPDISIQIANVFPTGQNIL